MEEVEVLQPQTSWSYTSRVVKSKFERWYIRALSSEGARFVDRLVLALSRSINLVETVAEVESTRARPEDSFYTLGALEQ